MKTGFWLKGGNGGSTPTSESQLYSEAFTLTETTTIIKKKRVVVGPRASVLLVSVVGNGSFSDCGSSTWNYRC